MRGVIVASPSNPTGTMVDRAQLTALRDWCRRHGAWLISDEIYHGIEYGAVQAATAAHLDPPGGDAPGEDEGVIVVNSFSKYFSMTGWRLGWLVLPPALLRPVERLAQNLAISPPALSQHAALAAFSAQGELDGHVARYRRNRDILLGELPGLGWDRLAPADGAFFLYADVSRMTHDSESFCRRLLEDTGVALTPGVDFDPDRGRHYVRLSFAGMETDVVDAVRRLRGWRG